MSQIWKSIRRTPYQSGAAFLVLFFTLLLSITLFLSLSFLYGLLGYVETRPQVTAYFQDKATQADIFKIRTALMNTGKVQSVKYVSKDDAFKIYKELNKDNPLLLEMVSSDILPASLEIYAKQPSYLPQLADFLKKQPGVDEVHFQKDILDRLLALTDILRKSTFVLFMFLIVMAIVVLTTSTLFKIALKKDEIELLRLIGASHWYIKKPFLLETIFFGLSATIVSFLVILAILFSLNPFLTSYLRGIPNLTLNYDLFMVTVWPISWQFLALTFGIACVFAIFIAIVATSLASRKYLHA